jgi:hypothetical protein
MSGTMSGGGDSSSTAINPNATSGFTVGHNINSDGTGFSPGMGKILIYIAVALAGLFLVVKLARK